MYIIIYLDILCYVMLCTEEALVAKLVCLCLHVKYFVFYIFKKDEL